MKDFIALFIGSNLKTFLFRALAVLGLGIITYSGGDLVISQFTDFIASRFFNLPPIIGDVLGVMKIDVFMSLVLSAYVARFAITSALGGGKKLGVR
jgi:hypothetical protein